MFVEVINAETQNEMQINLDHVTKIVRCNNKYVFTDIHNNKIVVVYTLELANIIECLKQFGKVR